MYKKILKTNNMKTYIKKSNVLEIDKHIKDQFKSKIIETKLFALLKLIDKKGFYIGYIKTTYKNGSFKLQTFSLKNK
jgi:metal-dependent HD superfamily phosphatase/phosphodiesterase